MKTFWKLIFILFPMLALAELGGGPGNTGDPVAQSFVTQSFRLADVLDRTGLGERFGITGNKIRKAISETRISSQDKLSKQDPVTGVDEDPAALNFPEANPPLVQVGRLRWKEIEKDPIESLTIPLHEWAAFLKDPKTGKPIEINRYDASAQIRLALQEFPEVLKKEKNSADPDVLLEQSAEDDTRGMPLATAEATCDEYRRVHEHSYFFVSCLFITKSWQTEEKKLTHYDQPVFLGYITNSSSYSSRNAHSQDVANSANASESVSVYGGARAAGAVMGVYHGLYGLAEAQGGLSHSVSGGVSNSKGSSSDTSGSNSSFNQSPVLRTMTVPYSYTETASYKIYGLRILGLGKISHESMWKLLYDSRSLAGSGLSLLYATQRQAYVGCNRIQMNSTRDFRFYKSECEVRKEGDEFYFVIKTQNPFLPLNPLEKI